MTDESKILNGSFKGIPIAIDSATVAGGRKTSINQFPNRDTQSVEDLGLMPRKYSLEIVVSDKQDQDYFGYRNSLIAALESKGPGELIHPLYGRIDNVVAVNYSLSENFSSFGSSRISVNFEVDNSTGIPTASLNVITQVAAANTTVQNALIDDIANNFTVSTSFAGNFEDATSKVAGIIDAANGATEFIGEAAQTLNEFISLIGELSADINSLVSSPSALANAVGGLFASVNGLYSSASATFDTFIGFFGFGDDDVEIRQNTAGRIERDRNNKILNGAVSASSLGYAYLAASRIEFQTTLEIDTITAQLDAQYLAIQENGSSQSVKDAITDMRVTVLRSLDDARVDASQIVSVFTLPTTVRLLTFNYYGEDDLAQTIADLNNIDDVSFIEGTVEILTS